MPCFKRKGRGEVSSKFWQLSDRLSSWFWHFQYLSLYASKVDTIFFLYTNIIYHSKTFYFLSCPRVWACSYIPNGYVLILTMFIILTYSIFIVHIENSIHTFSFFLGRLRSGGARGPGVFFVLPCVDNYCKVDLRTVCKCFSSRDV